MPRKSTSSSPGDMEDSLAQPLSPSLAEPSPSQPTERSVQATEQQLKARAEGVSIEDYLLPRSLTLRLAKSVLPPNTSLQKDAVLAIQKAATVFVSYLSSHANEATLKRTVAPSDVFNALSELELDGFRPRLEKELDAFTDLKAGKRKSKSTAGKEGLAPAPAAGAARAETGAGGGAEGGDGEVEKEKGIGASVVRGAKRVKRDGNVVQDDEEDGDETQDEPEKGDENETEVEEEEEEEDEEEDEDDEGVDEEEDPDRVEDLDRDSRAKRTMDPDAAGDDDTESDEENGPGSQLRGDLGLG